MRQSQLFQPLEGEGCAEVVGGERKPSSIRSISDSPRLFSSFMIEGTKGSIQPLQAWERVSRRRRRRFNPISRLFQPNASRRSAWSRARSRTRISRQAPRSTRETLAPTWHGKRTFSRFDGQPTIRHPYLSADYSLVVASP